MSITVLQGNCLDRIKQLDDLSIDCVVSSPPYYGLRDYGTAQWQGGNPDCQHTINDGTFDPKKGKMVERPDRSVDKTKCTRCGADRIDEQFGLEPTIADYIANTVKVFETMRPKLKDTATIWWNVGDSYAMSSMRGKNSSFKSIDQSHTGITNVQRRLTDNYKAKDLMMIPNRVAIALQEAGWYIRSEIIWHKPNPMPESVKDRPTSAHEKIWLITKNKKYYYDAEAIKEDAKTAPTVRDKVGEGYDPKYAKGARFSDGARVWGTEKKNKRNVWKVTTKPCKHAHFATFPKDLIEPCILAGCPIDGTVLDPFGGSGTVGIVAENNNRNSVLIELNDDYIEIMNRRFRDEIMDKILV